MSEDVVFCTCRQEWSGDYTHVDIQSSDNACHCRLTYYKHENVCLLTDVFVRPEFRKQGYCKNLLDFVEAYNAIHECRPYILVYVDKDADAFIRQMYTKRGYVILNNWQ